MGIQLKKLNVGIKTSTVTYEHNSTKDYIEPLDSMLALAILTGGYNEYGRHIPLEKYKQIKERFDQCIDEVKKMV